MPWSKPAARMREFVSAMRAIWDCWNNGTKLDFRGDFYTHTLMTPFFNPGPNPYGPPKVFLAGVGELMTEVAGEVCDGFICHGFTTERYLREVTLPALERGRAKAGKTLEGFEIAGPAFVVTGTNEEELERGHAGHPQQIAFYGSTPAYRGVLDLHGWGGLQDELNGLSKQGKWVEMGELIDDEMLSTFAVVGEPEAIAPELLKRYGDCITRISFYTPYKTDPSAGAASWRRSRRADPRATPLRGCAADPRCRRPRSAPFDGAWSTTSTTTSPDRRPQVRPRLRLPFQSSWRADRRRSRTPRITSRARSRARRRVGRSRRVAELRAVVAVDDPASPDGVATRPVLDDARSTRQVVERVELDEPDAERAAIRPSVVLPEPLVPRPTPASTRRVVVVPTAGDATVRQAG